MEQTKKFDYMTKTPIPKLICSLATPTIISMLITSFYNMADTFFVAKINTSANGAVGIVFSIMAIIQAIGFFFGHGSGNFISRSLGKQDNVSASKMASIGFFSALGSGFIFAIIGITFLKPIAIMLGSTDTILPYTCDYLKYILIGTPYMMASLVLNNQLRFQGSAMYGMIGITVGGVLNIILDPIFIFTFDLGISGAAIATIISQFISFCILLICTTKGNNIRISIKNFKFEFKYYKEIFRGGFPSLCRQGLASIATISLNKAARPFGDPTIAAMSIVSKVTMFANSALIGFGQGFQPVCGFNYGAKIYKRVREAFWFCVKYSAIFLIIITVIGISFAPQIVTSFQKDDPQVIEIGTLALRLYCLTFPLNSFIVLTNMMLQSIGKSLKASILASARQGLFYLPIIWIFSSLFGILGIQLSQPLADIATFLIAVPFGLIALKEMKLDNLT